MKKVRNILLLIVIAVGFYSCEYEIDYSKNLPKDKLVVASFIEADSTISFVITKSAIPGTYNSSFGITSPSGSTNYMPFVLDAKAELYINGSLAEVINGANTDGRYVFTKKPKQNDKIELRLDNNKLGQAIGRANLNIEKPIVDYSLITLQEGKDEMGNKSYRVAIYLEIIDDGIGDNYYKIEPKLFAQIGTSPSMSQLSISNAILLSENIQGIYLENATSMYDEPSNRYGIISNKLFKGKVYKIKLAIPINSFYHYGEGGGANLSKRIFGKIYVSKIEKQAYDYLFTLNRYSNNGFMSEPVIISDGIENAYGFISGKNTLKVKQIDTTFQ